MTDKALNPLFVLFLLALLALAAGGFFVARGEDGPPNPINMSYRIEVYCPGMEQARTLYTNDWTFPILARTESGVAVHVPRECLVEWYQQ